jgi:hypothetical protein
MTLLEPDVALTDLVLAIECGVFTALLSKYRTASAQLRLAFITFFAATGIAAFLGFIAHGFLPDEQAQLYRVVWRWTLIAIGVAALASWAIGALVLFSARAAERVTAVAALLFAGYVLFVLFVSQAFAVAVIHYLPAAAFLLIAFLYAYRRRRSDSLEAGIAGVALALVAAAVQQGGIGLHPRYFNHNALYHLIQAVALFLLFWAGRGLLKSAAK